MKPTLPRRTFIKQTTLFSTGLALASPLAQPRAKAADQSPGNKIVIGVMGTNGRGLAHINHFLSLPNVEVGYVCDVDDRAIQKGLQTVAKRNQTRKPKGVTDVRKVLDDPRIDVLSIAAPNHWHAPATILACAAGKHVYVEKPGSHTPHESRLMVEAARKHDRIVQMGNQRRSWPWVMEAMQALHSGELGKVFFARAWYNNRRPSIGRGQPAPVPGWLDYDLWQGPAARRPFKDNLVHYNWHWHWHWGNGELGNNGIHALDLARWGLQVDYPVRVTSGGGRYHYQDDQETPDIYVTTFDFGSKGASWESHSCDPHGFEGARFGVTFYAEKGTLIIAGNECRLLDPNDKLIREIKSPKDDTDHFSNFLESIRSGKTPHANIADAQKSTMLCHLGNMAWRSGQTVNVNPATGDLVNPTPEQQRLWSREYEPGWEPKI